MDLKKLFKESKSEDLEALHSIVAEMVSRGEFSTHIEALASWAEDNGVEYSDIPRLLSKTLKEILRAEGSALNLLKGESAGKNRGVENFIQ